MRNWHCKWLAYLVCMVDDVPGDVGGVVGIAFDSNTNTFPAGLWWSVSLCVTALHHGWHAPACITLDCVRVSVHSIRAYPRPMCFLTINKSSKPSGASSVGLALGVANVNVWKLLALCPLEDMRLVRFGVENTRSDVCGCLLLDDTCSFVVASCHTRLL
jgi:hypothetical protein